MPINHSPKTKLLPYKKKLNNFLSGNIWIAPVLLIIIIFLFLLPDWANHGVYKFKKNEIAKREVKSPLNIKILDTAENKKKIEIVKRSFVPVYTYRKNASLKTVNRLRTLLNLARNSISFQRFKGNVGNTYSPSFLKKIYSLKNKDIERISASIEPELSNIYQHRLIIASLPKNKGKIRLYNTQKGNVIISVSSLSGLRDIKMVVAKSDFQYKNIIINLLKSNVSFDTNLNDVLLKRRINNIEPSYIIIKKNEVLLRTGDLITPSISKKLNIINGYGKVHRFLPVLVQLIIISLLIFMLFFYMQIYEKKYFKKPNMMFLMFFNILIELILVKLAVNYNISVFIIPIAFSTLILYLFFPAYIAVLASLAGILAGSTFLSNGANFIIYQFVLIMAAVINTNPINKRKDILRNAAIISAFSAFSIFLLMLNAGSFSFDFIWYSLAQGLFIVVLFNGILQFFESVFGVISNISLSELSNMDHILLKNLAKRAPGTYSHSVNVGNLAAAAATAIGANELLARVGGYFHDIGKVEKYEYFIENRQGTIDIHKKLSPTLSYLVILSHVKEGEKLAMQYHLPKCIIDIISQHHGTSVISFFYQKALGLNIDAFKEEDFRYPGPKPQSKEAGIVMIADSIEAAVKALKKPGTTRIKGIVRELINQKFIDGQFDECELSLRDLNKIYDSLLKGIMGIHHQRIAYKQAVNKNAG